MPSKKKQSDSTPEFMSLMMDIVFKTLWILGSQAVKGFLYRVISAIVGFDVSGYRLSTEELGIDNYKSVANKVDILLISPDEKTKVNVELNRKYSKVLINKNDTYILKIAGESYAGVSKKELYKENYGVKQVNINNFPNMFHTNLAISEFGFFARWTDTSRMGLKIFDVTLPMLNKACYNGSEDLRKDLQMFTAKSYEEMDTIARGDKGREAVLEELKRLGSDPVFVDYYDHEAFEEAEKTEFYETGLADGKIEGKIEGQVEAQTSIIKNMMSNGFSINDISKMINISIQDINSLLSLS